MKVYVALKSVPDYHAPPAPYLGIFESLEGAIHALYPDREDFRKAFRKSEYRTDTWIGPDGVGEVRLVEVQP